MLRRKKYDHAIKLLEPEINRYHGVFIYYYILAVSYLHARVFNVAFTYFKLARDIKMRDPSVLLGLAVLYLRRGETDRAVDFYLEVQDLDERNRIARDALKIIRKYSGTPSLTAWVESGKLPQLFPPLPPAPPGAARLVIPLCCFMAALMVAGGILIKLQILPVPVNLTPKAEREGLLTSALDREEQDAPVQIDGSYRYILTRKEVFETYEDARTRFTEYRDEAAKKALNKLLESNASEAIKAKARLLISYMDVPGFDNLKDRFTYTEVIQEPLLYRDCYVIWRGMAANLETLQNTTSFNFLVGYDTRSTLQGIVPVRFDFSISLNTEQPLEILGRIVPISTEKGLDIRIEGAALHQSGLRLGSNQ